MNGLFMKEQKVQVKEKHVVLVSGDEEYRSEEALPMLGKVLAVHHGLQMYSAIRD